MKDVKKNISSLKEFSKSSPKVLYPEMGERLKEVFKGENAHALSKAHGGTSEQTIGRNMKGESWPNKATQELINEREFSINWVLFGQGSKRISYLEDVEPEQEKRVVAEKLDAFPVKDLAEAIQRKTHRLEELSKFSIEALTEAIQRKVQKRH